MKSNSAASSRKNTVLVVDDDSAVREVLARILAEEGYAVLVAASGPEALEIEAATPIDLVLLDLNMPRQSGWDTFEQLTNRNPLLAVIIVTARPHQLFTSLAAGVGALAEKPLDYPQLLKTIRALLAEPAETRLARLAGRPTEFRHLTAGPR